jgi:uncharacterized protein YbgA (DUF1722 family)/uncharacterized protein YbbK (DUF523 family)
VQYEKKINIGISSCLLGQEDRFDGGHKRDRFITDRLAEFVEFLPICPEMAIGLGVPRQPIKLVGTPNSQRVIGTRNPDLDVTEDLLRYARQTAGELANICGYIFKSKSPSCGMERVKLYPENGSAPTKDGVGQYASAIMEIMPSLPAEEEGRLNDPLLRENFIERIFVYSRWLNLCSSTLSMARLIDFHTKHKLVVLSRGQRGYKLLGRMIANTERLPLLTLADRYISSLMDILGLPATRRSHSNVLQHIQGYLKDALDGADKEELAETINQYRIGLLPLIVPITLLRHHCRRNPNAYIFDQVYLNPHPPELMLRNSL